MNNQKLDVLIEVAKQFAFALIEIRDKPMASYMFREEESYAYGMQIRAIAEQGLEGLSKLQEVIHNE